MGERSDNNGFPASRQRVEEMLGGGDAFVEVEGFIQASGGSREERDVLWVFAWLEQRRVARERGQGPSSRYQAAG